MNTETLSTELAHRNIILTLGEWGKLAYKAPVGAMTPELVAAIRAQKTELIEALTSAPDTGSQDDLQKWNSYYNECSWYKGKNTYNDSPFALALDYALSGHSGSCVAWISGALIRYYEQCQGREINTGTDTKLTSPRQFTELVRLSFKNRNVERLWALASNFHGAAGVTEIIGEYEKFTASYAQPRQEDEQVAGTPDEPTGGRQDERQEAPAKNTERKPWVTLFADIEAGRAITDTGAGITFPASCSLSQFLTHALQVTPVNRVFLCGELPGRAADGFISWLSDAGMLEDYTTDRRGHYFDTVKPETSVARYEHRFNKSRVDIRRITSWLGDDRTPESAEPRYTIEDASAALALVNRYIRQYFTPHSHIAGTPSTTFKGLWMEGNRIAGKKFEALPDETRGLIHGNSGQGRIEFFSENSTGKIPGLFYYDGIFMYAALTWGLPTEIATHDNVNAYAGKVPARYRIRYTVPIGWQHVGLFMTRKEDGWFYPGAAEAGATFETWADGAELDIAYNLPQGMPAWDITILERIVFKSEKESTVTKPLTTITEKIIKIREHMDRDKRQDAGREHIYKLASGAARNILLHGIGSFNRVKKMRTYILLENEPEPIGFNRNSNISVLDNNRRIYTIPEESTDTGAMHPEWPALVYGRCRARMTKHALSMPYSDIVAIRTDAIAVKHPVSAWEANNRVGTLRRKWAYTRAITAPASDAELDKIQRKALGK
jgi:hypothetical protein